MKKQPQTATGVMRTIVINEVYVASLISRVGGITYRGLKLLGEPPRYIEGWKERNLGKTITVDEGELIAEIEATKGRRGKLERRNTITPPVAMPSNPKRDKVLSLMTHWRRLPLADVSFLEELADRDLDVLHPTPRELKRVDDVEERLERMKVKT